MCKEIPLSSNSILFLWVVGKRKRTNGKNHFAIMGFLIRPGGGGEGNPGLKTELGVTEGLVYLFWRRL